MVLRGTDVIDLSTANAKSIKHNMMVQLVSEKNYYIGHWGILSRYHVLFACMCIADRRRKINQLASTKLNQCES